MGIAYQNSITPDEVNFLRASIGFRQIDPKQIGAGLKGSSRIVSAYDSTQVVGMARLIWDQGGVALLTDVIVLPRYQNQGIEEEMVSQILAFLESALEPGFGIQVDVRAWSSQEAFYHTLGFQASALERRGLPMQICLTNQIERTDARFGQCPAQGKAT